jgi:DNA mismatch endonuclease (patch repair protein)
LPGSPDLANRTRRWAIFVHGCFWHRHTGCIRTTTPKRNRPFWTAKFEANCARDRRVRAALRRLGFRTLVIWECQAEREEFALRRLRAWLRALDT